jgi:DNA-directed RNA polymerase sigma subunit (sigma70/sigma32)
MADKRKRRVDMLPSYEWSVLCERATAIHRIVSEAPPSKIPESERTVDERNREAIKKVLTPSEKRVTALLFGVGGFDDMSMDGICEVMGMTKPQVQVIKTRALRKLRRHQSIEFLKDYLD